MQLSHRLSTFFILVGLALLILFVASIISNSTDPVYLPISIVALLVGFLLRRNNKPASDSGRFGAVRRARERTRKRREESKNQKQKK